VCSSDLVVSAAAAAHAEASLERQPRLGQDVRRSPQRCTPECAPSLAFPSTDASPAYVGVQSRALAFGLLSYAGQTARCDDAPRGPRTVRWVDTLATTKASVGTPPTDTLLEKRGTGAAAPLAAPAATAVCGDSGDVGGGVNPRLRSDCGEAGGIGAGAWSSGCCAATPAHRSDMRAPSASADLSHPRPRPIETQRAVSYGATRGGVGANRTHLAAATVRAAANAVFEGIRSARRRPQRVSQHNRKPPAARTNPVDCGAWCITLCVGHAAELRRLRSCHGCPATLHSLVSRSFSRPSLSGAVGCQPPG
jgi:hypothetical protein